MKPTKTVILWLKLKIVGIAGNEVLLNSCVSSFSLDPLNPLNFTFKQSRIKSLFSSFSLNPLNFAPLNFII